MALHHLGLRGFEWARLEEDRVGNADLAEVMQEEAVLELGIVGEARGDLARQLEGERRDSLGVVPGDVVAELEGGRQRADGRRIGRLDPAEGALRSRALHPLFLMKLAQLL